MAYERSSDNKVRGDGLDAFVDTQMKSFGNQIAVRNAEDEANFARLVLEQNLPLEEQLSYRKEQLARISDDPTERRRIKGEISALNDRIEQKKFSDDFNGKLIEYASGISSVDSVLTWLKDQRNATTDQTILNTIDKAILDKTTEKFNLTKSLLDNQTKFALQDKTASVLDAQISKVQSAKAKALLAGDEDQASTLDLSLQALTRAKTESGISDTLKNFAISTITGYSSATNLLDSYNSKIANASGTAPITIGDTTYANEKEFWTYKRDSYIADQSQSGLFDRLKSEAESKVKTAASQNLIGTNTISGVGSTFDTLLARPELAAYKDLLLSTKQAALQTGANLLTDKILNSFAVTYDLPKANGELSALKALGVNVDDAYTKLLTKAADVKQGQVNNILGAAQTALANDPNLTPDKAIAAAIASGAGTVLSPTELATKTEGDIAKQGVATANQGTGTNDTRTTITTPPAAATTTPTTTTPATTTPAAPTGYQGGSIVDYLNSLGKSSDLNSRIALGKQFGIDYTKSKDNYATENTLLLAALRKNGSTPTQPGPTVTPSPTPVPPAAPTVVAPPAPAPTTTQPSTQQPVAPTTAPTGGYTFKKLDNGNVEVYQNGQRMSTGTASLAKSYGYTGT